jgi:hypothetical protein
VVDDLGHTLHVDPQRDTHLAWHRTQLAEVGRLQGERATESARSRLLPASVSSRGDACAYEHGFARSPRYQNYPVAPAWKWVFRPKPERRSPSTVGAESVPQGGGNDHHE